MTVTCALDLAAATQSKSSARQRSFFMRVFIAVFTRACARGVGHRDTDSLNRTLPKEHGRPEVTYVEYIQSAHFVEATMENWESEFLQMFLFIVLTACLYQKGSPESKPVDAPHSQTGKG
jgi:hypothetical protein